MEGTKGDGKRRQEEGGGGGGGRGGGREAANTSIFTPSSHTRALG